MIHQQKSLDELMQDVHLFPQVLCNIKTNDAKQLMSHPIFEREIARHECALKDRGRMLIRPSGTEPIVRVLLEGEFEDELLMRKAELEQAIDSIEA